MFRRRRDSKTVAEALERQKELIVCISRITEENDESVSQVAELLEAGVDASAHDYNLTLYYASQNYFSPLHYAARKGAFKTMQLLLQYKGSMTVHYCLGRNIVYVGMAMVDTGLVI